MRKTGTSQDHKRRKTLIRKSPEGIKAKHWPTALIVCPKFLIRNVRLQRFFHNLHEGLRAVATRTRNGAVHVGEACLTIVGIL